MYTITLPRTFAGESTTDMGKTPSQSKLESWSQWMGLIVVIVTLGSMLLSSNRDNEHRLTAIETKTELTSTNTTELVKSQREANNVSILSLQTNQVVLEILLKLRLPPEDRRKAIEKLAEIKAKRISKNSDFAGDSTAPPE